MKLKFSIIAVVFVAMILIAAGVVPTDTYQAEEDNSPWVEIFPGAVDYQKFIVSGPNRVYVARMHRDNPNVFIESSMGQGRLSGGLETVRNMFYRYEGALNYWPPDGGDPGEAHLRRPHHVRGRSAHDPPHASLVRGADRAGCGAG